METIKTYKNKRGQMIGWLSDDKVFRKKVNFNKHFFFKLNSWALDKNVVDDLTQMDCVEIRLKDTKDGTIYSIALEVFLQAAVEDDYGHGKQYFVREKYWNQDVTNSEQKTEDKTEE